MYKVGQTLNIGLYSGCKHQALFKTNAEVIKVYYGNWIHIKVNMKHGGYKEMFGTETQLKQLEQNYYKKNMSYYN